MTFVYKIGPEIQPNYTKELTEVTRIYKTTAFVLRSITTALKVENKPLFGALNTRQRDCILCLSRIAAIAAFHLRPATCRIMVSRALTPLLVPLSECKAANYTISTNASDALSVPDQIIKFMNSPFRAIRGTQTPQSPTHDSPITSPDGQPRSRDSSEFKRPSPSSPMMANEILMAHLHDEINILHVDMLSLAIQLSMTIGWTWVENEQILHACNRTYDELKVPDGSVDELFSIYLTLLGYIFQNMASFILQQSTEDDIEMINVEDVTKSEKLRTRFEELLSKMSKGSTNRLSIDLTELERHLTEAVVTFLQPIALLYNGITLIQPPDSLKRKFRISQRINKICQREFVKYIYLSDTSYNEFESLCRYLGLPQKLEDLLDGPMVDRLFEQ